MAGTAAFRSATRLVVSIGPVLPATYWYLAVKTLLHLVYTSSQLSLPSVMAFFTASMVCDTLSGRQSISLPAIKLCTDTSPPGKNLVTPFISSPSVKVRPLKPSWLRIRPVMLLYDNEV